MRAHVLSGGLPLALVVLAGCFSGGGGGPLDAGRTPDAGLPDSSPDAGCADGALRCPCYPNETCNGTLSCVSGTCVDTASDADASATTPDAAIARADGGTDTTTDAGTSTSDAGSDGGDCTGAADMIWMLDNSCSMAVEAAAVQDGMNAFASELAGRGVDVRVVLLSAGMIANDCNCDPNDFLCLINCGLPTSTFGVCIDAPFGSGACPDDSRPPDFLHLDVPVGSTDALSITLAEYPNYADTLRADVPKHFVIISDDNSATDATTFSAGVDALDPAKFADWTFHGIYSLNMCTDAVALGTVYDELVADTGGVAGDLCLQDFPPLFDAIIDAVEAGASPCP